MTTYIWEDSTWTISKDGSPAIVLFGRSVDDPYKTVKTIIHKFEPYFYAPADAKAFPSGIVKTAGGFIDALGRDVIKCYTKLPSDVPKVRGIFDYTDEADVLFDKRYVVDVGIQYAYEIKDEEVHPVDIGRVIDPRIVYFDIEVKSPTEIIPSPEDASWPIVSIQCMDSYTKRIIIFTFGVPQIAEDQIACASEVEMLGKFMSYVQEIDPDILTGWFSNGFDVPYIVKRAERLNIRLSRLTRLDKGYVSAERRGRDWSIRITGRQSIDMYDAFKKWYKAEGELESYDLKSVSAKFADFTYTDYGAHIDKMFQEGQWEEFLQYCRNDVISLSRINDKIKLFDFYEQLRVTAGVKLEETLMNSRMIESILMRHGIKPMPTRRYGLASDSYKGALVITPRVGVYEDVAVFDLTALYPTIIIGFNVSPDVDKTIPKVIGLFINEREKLRKLRMEGKLNDADKKKETVLKFIVNSFYGVLGWPGFRMYTPEMAGFITSTGREINTFLQACARERGFETIYGDTDSIFVRGIRTVDEGKELQLYFNERLKSWGQEKGTTLAPTIKFEKYYKRILFKKKSGEEEAAKKRYAGYIVWKEDRGDMGKLDFTGIEMKRSDQSKITKEVLEKFLQKVLVEGDIDAGVALVKEYNGKVRRGEVALYDISIPRGVKSLDKDNPWIRGVKNTDELVGVKVLTGQKPRVVYARGSYKELCVLEDMPEGIFSDMSIDWNMIARKTIESKMRSFIESVGRDWDTDINGQTSLEAWV